MGEAHEEFYLLDRNPEESARLNGQHPFLVDLIGNSPIHQSIPLDGIQAVADIATGTGIWLHDAASLLASRDPNPSQPYHLHGFDVSAAQFQTFPAMNNTEIHLSVQDCLKPFPAEYQGRYDLVHVRLMIGALRMSEYEAVVKNTFDILKPGGYLQWDEASMGAFDTDESPRPPLMIEIHRIMGDVFDKLGLCRGPPEHIEREAQRAGFAGLTRELYTTRSKPHLADPARAWLTQLFRTLIPLSMIRSGEEGEKTVARDRTEALVVEFEKHCIQAIPLVNLQVTIGMKPKALRGLL